MRAITGNANTAQARFQAFVPTNLFVLEFPCGKGDADSVPLGVVATLDAETSALSKFRQHASPITGELLGTITQTWRAVFLN